jgi:hypothetical protein
LKENARNIHQHNEQKTKGVCIFDAKRTSFAGSFNSNSSIDRVAPDLRAEAICFKISAEILPGIV